MDNENKNNQKQKIKIKANTFNKDKNNSILKNPMEIPLVLKNIVNTKKTEKITNKLLLKKNYILKEENYKKPINIVRNKVIKLKKANSNKILDVKSISKSFDGRPILKSISFSLSPGKIFGIFGQNGCGKTTLFNCITGTLQPNTGEIFFNGDKINEKPIHERSQLGISITEQHLGLFSGMTVYENLYAILEIHHKSKEKINNKIDELLNIFGLMYAKNLFAKNLSGGEYKRAVILQRICNPQLKVLLLDEPLAALSPVAIESLKKFLVKLKELNIALCLTDHQFMAIQDIVDECIVINDGEIVVSGTPKDVAQDKNAIKYYLGSSFRL